MPSEQQRNAFRRLLQQKGRELYRPMPWRDNTDPYYVLVSEMMLQQTQVARVVPKFKEFVSAFPDISSLALTPLANVLILWNGLGYNRRAKFLHDAAKMIVNDFGGEVPLGAPELQSLPGIGANTAGAVRAYAFNQPALFIETNIRTVLLHHFFESMAGVTDKQLLTVLERVLDRKNPRQFYWATMDYGAWLKAHGFGQVHRARAYKKQTPLKGSRREMRGRILKALSAHDFLSNEDLQAAVQADDRYELAVRSLVADGLVSASSSGYLLTKDV